MPATDGFSDTDQSFRWRQSITRIVAIWLFGAAAILPNCAKSEAPADSVTLYVSADDTVVQPVVEAFERETGIRVLVRGDTEATKTTGLVQRLRAEKSQPRADVFWSSEVFLTIALADEGVLASTPAPSDWPPAMRGAEDRWIGFASRARVCVFNTSRLAAGDAPKSMHDLLSPKFDGRIVIARPAFGTTRGHMAALVAMWGEYGARSWMRDLKAAGVRFVDGNSAVVRAVAAGEADIGLTDTDDVWAGQRLGWPVDLTYVRHDLPETEESAGYGALVIPNTVSLVVGGPNTHGAKLLASFLVSERVERMLALSDSRNVPVRPSLFTEFATLTPPPGSTVAFETIAAQMPLAMSLIREEWGQ